MSSARTPPADFEALYSQREDPWHYASSPYEAVKYARTLAVLDDRSYSRALEVGCSIGVFTTALADRCEAVVALDPSATALARAQVRLAGRTNVELVHGAVPEQLPAGPFDLVVCSEVLYYLGEALLLETLRGIEARLVSGGALIAVHFRRGQRRGAGVVRRLSGRRRWQLGPPSPDAPLSGDRVHELLRGHTRLRLTHEELEARWRLDRFDLRA